jgi:DNA-binding response OmpR family regulator
MKDLNKIFIVEDDMSILYGLRDIFVSNDFEVELSDSKEDMEELLQKIERFKPDSIILDIILPEMDGQELMRRIKANSIISDAEIFIFTDLSDEDGEKRSVGLGANYYFMKNEFDVYTFSNKVMRVMRKDPLISEDEKDEEEKDDMLVFE